MNQLSPVSIPRRSAAPGSTAETPADQALLRFTQALLRCQQHESEPANIIAALIEQVGRALAVDGCVLLPAAGEGSGGAGWYWQPGQLSTLPPDWHILRHLPHSPWLAGQLKPNEPIPLLSWPRSLQRLDKPVAGDGWGWAEAFLPSPAPTPERQHTERLAATVPATLATFQSALVARTYCQGSANGLIVLLCSQPHQWREKEIRMVQMASQQLAIALSQLQLKEQIERQLRHQALIADITDAIRQGTSLEAVYATAITRLVDVLGITQGLVLSFKYADPQVKGRTTPTGTRARATVEFAHTTHPDGLLPLALREAIANAPESSYSFQLSDCVVGQSLLNLLEQPLLLPPQGSSPGSMPPAPLTQPASPDAPARPQGEAPLAPLFNFAVLPSLLAMPLSNQGVGLGCLLLQHQEPRRWQPEEVELVRLVAAHLSSALIQANTLRKVQALVEERTAQLRHSMDVQAKLYEKSRQQVEQLQRMNQVMEEFLSTVSHELLTPLTSMKMAIKMLREAPLKAAQRDRYLDILDHQCSQETRLIRDLLTLQKIETHTAPLQPHQIDCQALLHDLQTVWQDTLQEQGSHLTLQMPQRPVLLRTDPESLHRILTELLTNAKKYSAPGQPIALHLAVETNQKTPCIKLTIENIGLGILPGEMPMIFEKFRRGQQALQATIPGIGLGLTLTRGLTSHLSGAIAATSTPITGTDNWRTRFTLTLPLLPEFAP